jgi:hypothetical protein
MATIGNDVLTFADIAKRMDPNMEDVASIVEVLNNQNDILKFLPWMEGNLPTGHRTTIRAGKPTVGTRRINQGVAPSKSITKQVDEGTMLLEGWSEADTETLRLGGNEGSVRASEDVSTLEAMNDFFSTTFFYGNPALNVDRFLGIAPRYNSLSGEYAGRIINAQGSGSDNTSIWLVGLGERGLHGIYPKGTKAGIERKDLGLQVISENGTRRTVKQTQFIWHCGLALKDYRHMIRIANIDVSNLSTFGSGSDTSARLLRHMIQAMNKIPGNPQGYGLKYAFLMNETTKTWADIMTTEKTNGAFTMKEIHGQEFTHFRNIPIIKCDAITDAESAVA